MEKSHRILALLLAMYCCVLVNCRYLITTPRIYRTGTVETINVNLYHNKGLWNITATLQSQKQDDAIAVATKTFQGDSQGTMEIEVPRKVKLSPSSYRGTNAILTIFGHKVGSKTENFTETQSLDIEKQGNSLFIQTDKPIYKPGQTIRMRVIGVDPTLKPLIGKVEHVTISNPSGVRMMQWNGLEFKDGIISLKMPLSSQPVIGDWKIQATFNGEKVTKEIGVSKYVLPKFEVTIEPPPFIATDSKTISGSVCARYTYGQLVTGTIKITFHLKQNMWWRKKQNEKKITVEKKVKGCHEFSFSNSDLGLTDIRYNYHGITLNITASMTEEATGISLEAKSTETPIVPYRVKLNFDKDTPRYFKPGLSYYGKLLVTSPDGQPLSGEDVRITAKSGAKTFYNKQFVVKNGVVDFEVKDTPLESNHISIDARHGKGTIFGKDFGVRNWYSTAGMYCSPWYSKSWSVLGLRKPKTLKVGTKARVNFRYTTMENKLENELFYHLVCGGNVTSSGSKPLKFEAKKSGNRSRRSSPPGPLRPIGPKGDVDERPKVTNLNKADDFIEFQVTQSMVPSCRLLAYYVRKDGETVADNIEIDVEDKLENQVLVRFDDNVRRPGQPVEITMKAAPGSTVALAGVDKSVRLLRQADDLTYAKVVDILSSQDIEPLSYNPGRRQCDSFRPWYGVAVPRRQARMILPPYYRNNFVDASKAFHESGMVYFSDLTVESRPCPKYYGWRSRKFRIGEGGAFGFGGGRGPVDGPVAVPLVLERTRPDLSNAKKTAAPPVVRKNFPETWLWTEEIISDPSGQRTIKATVPDTITSWHLSAFAMSSKSGIGVSKLSLLTVFQPFFVSFTLPYSVIRGEEVSVVTTVFNYMTKCATVRLRLSNSSQFDLSSPVDHRLCICGNEAKSVKYVITPRHLGNIPLQVTVETVQPSLCQNASDEAPLGVSDAVKRKLLVEPEGVRQEYTYSNFICPQDNTKGMFHDNIRVSLPSNIVDGSVHATISAIGDLMGPSLSGLEGLLKLPTGCGEQNMVKFAPNIYVMQYLNATKQITEEVEDKAVGFLRTGYQRELTYKRKDGSYSAFGDRDEEGSLWLTAFVVRSFSQARPFIFVDAEEIKSTLNWIKSKQLDTGCFRKHGQLFHKALKGGVTTPVTLTAYVVISLLESGVNPKSDVITKALGCITAQKNTVTDSYSNAIIAYALTLAKHPDRAEFLRRLKALAIEKDKLMHWEKKEKPEKPSQDLFWQPPYHRSASTNIEMTSYALMAMIDDGTDTKAIADAMPIIRWITKQRNGQGGFSSTQDTCVALQSLSKYAKAIYGNGDTRMRIDVGYPRSLFFHEFRIDDNNRLVLQRVEVPENTLYSKKIPIDAVGDGCALVQTDVSYNIPDVKENPAFDLSVGVKPPSGARSAIVKSEAGEQLCQPLEMKVYAKWLREGRSGMAVIDVKLVSGFTADEESLDRLMNRLDLNLMKFELEENKVVLYFNEIENVSFSFLIKQTVVVKNTKPASATVYEYYDTDKSATTMYNVTEEICTQVPEPPTTPPVSIPSSSCPLCPNQVNINQIQPIICKTKQVLAVRTIKDGQTRLEYLMSTKNFTSNSVKPAKRNARPINISISKACGPCSALQPRNKAFVLLQNVESANMQNLNLTGVDSLVVSRKDLPVNLLRNALNKCSAASDFDP
uniref:Alpha-2-macroglobulin n=1 Tax=Diadumene lineata TaxID=1789172 RepID=D4QA01_9CNID|nr:alpha-2-macroglobulin [Diadumene lineata]